MTVVFRADASDPVGTGHVMRCRVFAEELRARGVESRFICREHPGNLIEAIRARSFPVAPLAGASVGQAEDATQTIDAIRGAETDDIPKRQNGWLPGIRISTDDLL